MENLETLLWDKAHIGADKHTRSWLDKKDVHTLAWLPRSADLKIIEIVWRYVVREEYKDGKGYESVEALDVAVFDSLMNFSSK